MRPGSCRQAFITAVVLGAVLMSGLALAASPGFTSSNLEGSAADLLGLDPGAVPILHLQPVDVAAEQAAEAAAAQPGEPPRFAIPERIPVTPDTDGRWEDVDARWVIWRQRIVAPGALSLNLGFSRYRLPKGGRLAMYATDPVQRQAPDMVWVFTERNNETHGQLWTPVVPGDDITIELLLPRDGLNDYALELEAINKGYRFFGGDLAAKAGACNIDVVCPEGDPWRSEIASVGVYTLQGQWDCTGAMVNNTAEDLTPYFLTANHCGIDAGNASTMVVYWNFQSPTCGAQSGGSPAQNQTGATYLASSSTSDFCLVRLNAAPDPAWNLTWAGWYRGSDDPVSATAIHHPNTDEKSISFEYDPTSTTGYLDTAVPGDGTHIRITDWDVGTTEPGSSGSPLFNPDHRIVGQLHGGYAACGNNESDWYGRFSVTWPNVSQWLDPLGTAPLGLDTFDPNASPFLVLPKSGLSATGDVGGPFAPDSLTIEITNGFANYVDYQVAVDVPWAVVTNGSGALYPGSSVAVTVAIGGTASSLGKGTYTGTISILNLTDGLGDTTRPLQLVVGVPEKIVAYPLDTDPGWTMDAGWAFGVPQGSGGAYGNPDPVAGATGTNVLGSNLAGDYESNLPERWLISDPIDMRGVTQASVRFQRWLGVEQSVYDHASFRVSNDGVNYTTIWENTVQVSDAVWTQVSYDISAIADDQPTVYLAWVMGTTDGSWQFCGWNIDDIELWGVRNSLSPVLPAPSELATLGNHPNPFNPLTRISFDLPRAGRVALGVYDLQGRLVRQLVDGNLPAGPGRVVWDGTDDTGRSVGSGIYFALLRSGQGEVRHKMVLVK